MRRLRFSILMLLVALAAWLQAPSARAVNPDEMLADPVLEQRARDLSATIRCMKCQNQSIDDSDADLAHDLRILVRERIVAGDSDQQVLDYLVDRYGDFVLLKPRFTLQNLLLWGTPALALLFGLYVAARTMRRNRSGHTGGQSAEGKGELSGSEQELLGRILEERQNGSG